MPHLQFDINKQLSNSQKKQFSDIVKSEFSRIMQTGTEHIAISVREFNRESLTLGRANDNDLICLMNLDIRSGRSNEQKVELVKAYIGAVSEILGVEKKNQYVTFTEHPGVDFNFCEKSLKDWSKQENSGHE